MSTVELPLVRSSNSSASSSRSHLHSAGSIKSEKSARSVRSQRSQYQEEDNEEEDDSDENAQSGDEMHDEEPQESSGGGLWDEVEHFLNKPSPSFSTLSGKTSTATVSKPPKSTLPNLTGKRTSSDNQATRASRPARAVAAASTAVKTIDPKLLQEAFAYANQLQQITFADDDEEQQQSSRTSKAKMLVQRAALGRTYSSSSSSSVSSNVVSTGFRGSRAGGINASSSTSAETRKKKANSNSSSVYSSAVKPKAGQRKKRSTSEESQPNELKSKPKGHMDPQTLQALVSNFQNGTSLEELRRELAASQQSMTISRQVLQEAAQNFFQSH